MTKIKNLMFIALIGILFSSCSTTFYQIYQTKSEGNLETTNQEIFYEDEDCKISYNMWDNTGDIGFKFYNKTDQNIFINLEESFFVLNGIANNYYKNRVYSNSKMKGSELSANESAALAVNTANLFGLLQNSQGVSVSSSSGRSISYTEEKIIVIPPNTAKIIDEYNINNSLYRDCDLYRYPTKKQIKTLSFDKNNSPLVFSNRIAYSKGESMELKRIENSFYVSDITNYPEKEATTSEKAEFCGEKDMKPTVYFKNVAVNKFYLMYSKGKNGKKH